MLATSFQRDGFAVLPDILDTDECDSLSAHVALIGSDSPGTRSLLDYSWCQALASRLRRHADIAAVVPADFVAAQCTYFEKSREQNWLVPVHQDVSIPVKERVHHAGLRGWSEKEGNLFVQPPVDVLERLVAVRVHLDACGFEDGPLQFVRGTHLFGRISPAQASELKTAGPLVTCTSDRGGVLMMRPLALHASSKATGTSRRRVLHFVFGPAELPYGLRWA
jgi:hypothetical protein